MALPSHSSCRNLLPRHSFYAKSCKQLVLCNSVSLFFVIEISDHSLRLPFQESIHSILPSKTLGLYLHLLTNGTWPSHLILLAVTYYQGTHFTQKSYKQLVLCNSVSLFFVIEISDHKDVLVLMWWRRNAKYLKLTRIVYLRLSFIYSSVTRWHLRYPCCYMP